MVEHTYLPVPSVEFDPMNPRIASLLEPYERITPEIVGFALQPGDSKFNELRQAIITHEGIVNPIIVNHVGDTYIAIEGNTRLAIYKQLHKEHPDDERWSHIPAIVYDNMRTETVDAIRLQAHLVGVRNWSPFAKARYLYMLHEQEHIPFHSLVEFCGGNQLDIQRNISAYRDMNEHYKQRVAAEDFDERKFSLFFESQKPKIRETLLQFGFTTKDVATWVIEGKFEPRQELIRKLPEILSNPRARDTFFRQGAQHAEQYLERPELAVELQSASLLDLCAAVQQKINDVKYSELREIKASEGAIQTIQDTLTDLSNFVEHELPT
jgi:hypothetical protein